MHRIRQRLIEERTALVNQVRGLLAEYGIVIGKGINQVRAGLPVILEDGENGLTGFGRELFNALREELIAVDERIAGFDKRIAAVHAANPLSQKRAENPLDFEASPVAPISSRLKSAATTGTQARPNWRRRSRAGG